MLTMDAEAREVEHDWRLEVDLDVVGSARDALRGLLRRLRDPHIVREIEATASHGAVITHDGRRLFAYVASEAALAGTRNAIEEELRRAGSSAILRVSYWDNELDQWHQTDPPASTQDVAGDDAVRRNAEATETRTMVASSGKLIRTEFEQTMLEWADKLGVECTIIEHPHLLTTQVAFTVTGPRRKLDEFSHGLIAEGWATIRTETGVMLSPL